jgi:hypothetical protein
MVMGREIQPKPDFPKPKSIKTHVCGHNHNEVKNKLLNKYNEMASHPQLPITDHDYRSSITY